MNEMRITRKRYELHKREGEKAKEQMKKYEKTIRDWEDAVRKIGDMGNQIVLAINIDDETGAITTDCEIATAATVMENKLL